MPSGHDDESLAPGLCTEVASALAQRKHCTCTSPFAVLVALRNNVSRGCYSGVVQPTWPKPMRQPITDFHSARRCVSVPVDLSPVVMACTSLEIPDMQALRGHSAPPHTLQTLAPATPIPAARSSAADGKGSQRNPRTAHAHCMVMGATNLPSRAVTCPCPCRP